MHSESLMVVCLCAEWCGTCREYRQAFRDSERRFPRERFVWIDIEEEADLMGEIDIENFPSLLIARAGRPVFFGPILPHPGHLTRLVETLASADTVTIEGDEITRLARRIETEFGG